jgi:BirA family biotin operon repressor/biotin-[acetyl-CoA-carboxylase] ligase
MNEAALFRWDGWTAPAVAERFGLPHVELLAEVDSTLDVAHARAEGGTRAGALIVADTQRAGRGRMGRSWSSEPGRGVWCTMIERPADASALDVLSIRVGLGVAERLDAIAHGRVDVKWPNDLVLGNRKLGGILVEARWVGTTLEWVAIGVGVNVLAPDGVEGATGLPAGTKRFDVLSAVVAAVRDAGARGGHLDADELARFHQRDAIAGRRLVGPGTGVAEGIAADGALLVRTASGGALERHRVGTVQFAEEP